MGLTVVDLFNFNCCCLRSSLLLQLTMILCILSIKSLYSAATSGTFSLKKGLGSRQLGRQIGRQVGRQVGSQVGRQVGRNVVRQVGRQIQVGGVLWVGGKDHFVHCLQHVFILIEQQYICILFYKNVLPTYCFNAFVFFCVPVPNMRFYFKKKTP